MCAERLARVSVRFLRLPFLSPRGILFFVFVFSSAVSPLSGAFPQKSHKLPKPRVLDEGVTFQRDPATGELRIASTTNASRESPAAPAIAAPAPIRVVSQIVPITCSVFAADGTPVLGLSRGDFRVFDDGAPSPLTYFDESTEPASVALVIDASPSVLRDSAEMKEAASALIEGLAPADEVAVVDFSAHTYVQTGFTPIRELLRRAVDRVDVRQLLGDTGGSNIYQSVYLTAAQLLAGRSGRKAIVLLTDGEDSGLGLTLNPESAAPRPGLPENRLTFDDVTRLLATNDIQIFAVSTETRPRIMTPVWLAAHSERSLLTEDARRAGIPAYTLYLAEIVRRSGGELYFLHESDTLADTFRLIAQRIGIEYTLGIAPASAEVVGRPDTAPERAGWHQLRVAVVDHDAASVVHRAAYYVPAPR